MTTQTNTSPFKLQTIAILLMMAGWGWIAGNFAAPFDTFWIGVVTAVGHGLPIVLLLVFSLQFFSARNARQYGDARSNWGGVAITILAIVAIIGSIVLIALGASNPDPNAVGVKSPDDFIPVIILNSGGLLWLAILLVSRQRLAEATRAESRY